MKKVGIIATIFVYCLYLLLWCFIVAFASLAGENGLFSVFEDFYGSWSIFLGCAIAVMFLMAPVYLRKFIKKNKLNKELKISVLSIVFTLVFIVISFGAFYVTAMQFQQFTPEKWLKYPRERYLMVDSLKEEHRIIGMGHDEVIKLLGTPDTKTPAGYLSYSYEYGDIEISFDSNDRVLDTYVH